MAFTLNFDKSFANEVEGALTKFGATIGGSYGVKIRQAARFAIEEGLTVKPINMQAELSSSCRILASHTWFETLDRQAPTLSNAQKILFAANAFIEHVNEEGRDEKALIEDQALLPLPGLEKREQQSELANFLTHKEAGQPLRLCEASTGIGKGLAIVVAAVQTLNNHPESNVVICAPTLAVVEQLILEYERLATAYNLEYSHSKAISTTDFISEVLAEYWCEEHSDHPEQPLFKKILASGNYEMSAFKDISDIPLHELSLMDLPSTTKDKGRIQFEMRKESAGKSKIIFCSHTMLTLHLLQIRRDTKHHSITWQDYIQERDRIYQQKQERPSFHSVDNSHRVSHAEAHEICGFFNDDSYFFIDESHILDESMSLAMQNSVSLMQMRRILDYFQRGKTKLLGNKAKEMIKTIDLMLSTTEKFKSDTTVPLRGSRANIVLKELESTLNEQAKQTLTKPTIANLIKTTKGRNLYRQLTTLINVSSDKQTTSLTSSPIKKFVSITSYNPNTDGLCDLLCKTARGVSYTSATLHIPSDRNKLGGYADVAMRLQCEQKKTATHPPIISKWLKENVEAFVAPQTLEFDPSNDDYIEYVAEDLADRIQDTIGGTLVLCTSYHSIEKLSKLLPGLGISNPILSQTRGVQIAKIRQQYITLYKNGRNPVWLATGGAWTGLDISDNSADPEDDNAVALLALDKLPFVNISDGKKDFHKAKMDCMFKLKQGIGRLVRRPGRNNMKIVLYDGRIHNKTSGTYWPMRKYYVEGYKAKKL